jgi:IS605 OrfB family transposase
LKQGNAFTLHKLTYQDCKTAYPDLVSDLHCQARQKASEAVKSAITLAKKGRKVNQPSSTLCPPRFNLHTFKVDWAKGVVNLATTDGRQKVKFDVPGYVADMISEREVKTATADLIYRKGKFVLHVVVKLPEVEFIDNGTAIGVDLGVCRPAVTSDGRMHGEKVWREISKRRFRLKRKLQSNGSKSAKRHLRTLAGAEMRFRRDCDHVLSSRILYGVEKCTTIVVENLTNIRQRVKATRGDAKRRLHSWSFAQIKSFLEYKAEERGIRVVAVDPRHTSQRCNACGSISRNNRRSQSKFVCASCKHKANADANASKNIRDRYLVGWFSPSGAVLSETVSSQLSATSNAVDSGLGTSHLALAGGI